MATEKAATTRKRTAKKVESAEPSVKLDIASNIPKVSDFVFMEKTAQVLEIGMLTGKNVILWGSGGHGKSELTQAFFAEKGITPFIMTMGTGLTTDRLFGGLDIPTFNSTGKIEYLVENSFMNHEYVVFEELFDAPDFILEQLKDILSSGTFRNGGQTFEIKTKYIICATNRTREEFAKNASLQALMERFPLEHNVIWDNYNEISYKTLLESRFGQGNVDPIIPFILQKYASKSIIISPRIAIVAYELFMKAGIDSLMYLADFSKKSEIIKEAVKEFEDNAALNKIFADVEFNLNTLKESDLLTGDEIAEGKECIKTLESLRNAIGNMKVSDSFVQKLNDTKNNLDNEIKAQKKRIMIATSIND
jgi:hypothetical protein